MMVMWLTGEVRGGALGMSEKEFREVGVQEEGPVGWKERS